MPPVPTAEAQTFKVKLKTCYWNIHGIKSRIVPNKLCDHEFLTNLCDSDILAISETHSQEKNLSIPGYKLVKHKIRDKKHNGPKISGGLAVFIKENLHDLVHVVPNTSENSIWVKLKQNPSSPSREKDIYLGSFYLSPERRFRQN